MFDGSWELLVLPLGAGGGLGSGVLVEEEWRLFKFLKTRPCLPATPSALSL